MPGEDGAFGTYGYQARVSISFLYQKGGGWIDGRSETCLAEHIKDNAIVSLVLMKRMFAAYYKSHKYLIKIINNCGDEYRRI